MYCDRSVFVLDVIVGIILYSGIENMYTVHTYIYR